MVPPAVPLVLEATLVTDRSALEPTGVTTVTVLVGVGSGVVLVPTAVLVMLPTGTLYLLLKRLKDEDYVTTYLQEGSEGPARKYYKLSATGKQYFEELNAEWREFVTQVGNLLQGRENV